MPGVQICLPAPGALQVVFAIGKLQLKVSC